MPVPPPKFKKTIMRVFSNGSTEKLSIEESELRSDTGVLTISASQLRTLFEGNTDILRIMCDVSNEFGSDNMTTDIRVCGIYHSICNAQRLLLLL